jgi:hypothetical protein
MTKKNGQNRKRNEETLQEDDDTLLQLVFVGKPLTNLYRQ